MGKAATPRKSRQKKDVQKNKSTAVAAGSSPAPVEETDEPPKREGMSLATSTVTSFRQVSPAYKFLVSHQPSKEAHRVEEREGQGLCVLFENTWRPAIWHHELVTSLEKALYGVQLYDVEPPRRNENQAPEDITTFLAHQESWDFESKEGRPDIVFQLYPNDNQYPDRHRAVPWLESAVDGVIKIVLDIFSHRPLRDFKNIPLQLATNVEGGRLEAMGREDSRIVLEDFRQRMIPLLDGNGEPQLDKKGDVLSERPEKNALISIKTLFRNKCRCLSWNQTRHDSAFDKRLFDDITKEDEDANTTRNLPDLSYSEVTAVRSLAKGRKSKVTEANPDSGGEVATKNESDLDMTQNGTKKSAAKPQTNEATTDVVEDRDVQPSPQVSLRSISTRVIETGSVAKKRRWGRSTQKTQHVNSESLSQSSTEPLQPLAEGALQNGPQVIDPALITLAASQRPAETTSQNGATKFGDTLRNRSPTIVPALGSPAASALVKDALQNGFQTVLPGPITPAVSAPSTDAGDSLKLLEKSGQPTNVTQIEPPLSKTAQTISDHLAIDEPTLKRKLADDVGKPDSDTTEVIDDSGREADSSKASYKRQKILPPTHDSQQVLDVSGWQRPGVPSLRLGSVHNSGALLNTAAGSVQRRSKSPQPYGPFEVTPRFPKSTPLDRPRPYSPVPPSRIAAQHEQAKIINAEQARFADVSVKVSAINVLKAKLMKAWWESQVDTGEGGKLYGPRLNISLSQLGRNSTARTDGEVRTLLSAYNIPTHWSASSIDLRQNPQLRKAVHGAMCEADRWNERNYCKNYHSYLDLDKEGAWYLAPAQPSIRNHKDSRFTPFTSASHLNASLHHATWRYKQLTGRDFARSGTPAFLAVACSYHDAWCEIRRQIFLPYFLRFTDPVEAVAWMPELGMLKMWENGPEKWERSDSHIDDEFGCRFDREGRAALDPRRFGVRFGARKVCLPLGSVDLEAGTGCL